MLVVEFASSTWPGEPIDEALEILDDGDAVFLKLSDCRILRLTL